jgi:phage terminase small subunit
MALTTRETAFVEALLGEARGNQTKAAEMAGYAAGAGLSVQATRLIKRAHVQGGNATRAAELAGYAPGKGLSVQATRLMKRAHVQAAIAERRAALMRAEPEPVLTAPEDPAAVAERVAQWQAQTAPVMERRAILSRWARHDRHVISAIRAIDTLNRMDGVYVEKHEHAVLVPKPVIHEHVGDGLSPVALPPSGDGASDAAAEAVEPNRDSGRSIR